MDTKLDKVKLKQLRESKAWSQSHLAEVSGISLRTIQRIEKTGCASPESVKSICATFGIQVGEISTCVEHKPGSWQSFSNAVRIKLAKIDIKMVMLSFTLAFVIGFILSR
ncbi:helix-turn-helix transcriptional regulator [Pseudoalteromonas piscicida]|uniref:helix-turn-helix transcriptional regulator n=1 Tax=Pseudoalteromonas piscicida TaxID=43662 RepID=UPI003C7B88E3